MTRVMRKLSGMLVCVLLLAGVATTAYAHEAVDLDKSDCSLAVEMKYDGKPVAGGNLTLYRVGNITENNGDFGFKLYPELNCDADMESPQSEKTAREVCDCVVQQGLSGMTVDIGADGTAAFKNLATGLYLVRQEVAAPGFSSINPFLISIPLWDGKRYIYDITAAAKTGLYELPAAPDKPNPPADSKLPQTGQLNWPVPALLVLGGILLTAGLITKKKNDA